MDVVGLYHNPPEKAVVLCVDEKSQIQALDRLKPVLPMMPGMPERRSHDYARHGVTSLYAAFDIADGVVISQIRRRHRAAEFKAFLAAIDKTVPEELDVHVVCDNSSTHKTPAIKSVARRHPRFHLHFTPTGSSWIIPGRALIRYSDRPDDPARSAQKRPGAGEGHQGLDSGVEVEDRAVRLEKSADEILSSLAKYMKRIWRGDTGRIRSRRSRPRRGLSRLLGSCVGWGWPRALTRPCSLPRRPPPAASCRPAPSSEASVIPLIPPRP